MSGIIVLNSNKQSLLRTAYQRYYLMNTRKEFPIVTFIIPTLNAQAFLPRCLHAIRAQNYPQRKVEIIVSDAGSTDSTLSIAKKYKAIIIQNPERLHEPGKTLASRKAKGEILFYTDSDNILSSPNWLNFCIKAYRKHPEIMGYLPQTVPAPDSNSLDRYFGYMSTEPLTWFIYDKTANPRYFHEVYNPLEKTNDFELYLFPKTQYPLFGMSQGVGTNKRFRRDGIAKADDLLAGIKLINENGLVAYIPMAQVYHYHIKSFKQFLNKYRWRIRNNLQQKVQGMGLVNRLAYLNLHQKIRMYLFIPYALSVIFPIIDSIRLVIRYKDRVLLWHFPVTLSLAGILIMEYSKKALGINMLLQNYE